MRIEAKTDYDRGITCNVGLIQVGTGSTSGRRSARSMSTCASEPQLAEEMTHWFLNLEPIGQDVTLTVEGEMNRPPTRRTPESRRCSRSAGDLPRDRQGLLDVPLTGAAATATSPAARHPDARCSAPTARAHMPPSSRSTTRRWCRAPISARGCWRRWTDDHALPDRRSSRLMLMGPAGSRRSGRINAAAPARRSQFTHDLAGGLAIASRADWPDQPGCGRYRCLGAASRIAWVRPRCTG